jgi:hypothetical protein
MASGIGQRIVVDPTADIAIESVSNLFDGPSAIATSELANTAFDFLQTLASDANTQLACSSVEAEA